MSQRPRNSIRRMYPATTTSDAHLKLFISSESSGKTKTDNIVSSREVRRKGRTLAEEMSHVGEMPRESPTSIVTDTSAVLQECVEEKDLTETTIEFDDIKFNIVDPAALARPAILQVAPTDVNCDAAETGSEIISRDENPAFFGLDTRHNPALNPEQPRSPPLSATIRARHLRYLSDMYHIARRNPPRLPSALHDAPPARWTICSGTVGARHKGPQRVMPEFATRYGGSSAACLHAKRQELYRAVALTDAPKHARLLLHMSHSRAGAARYLMYKAMEARVPVVQVREVADDEDEREMRAPREEGDFREVMRAAEMAEGDARLLAFALEEDLFAEETF